MYNYFIKKILLLITLALPLLPAASQAEMLTVMDCKTSYVDGQCIYTVTYRGAGNKSYSQTATFREESKEACYKWQLYCLVEFQGSLVDSEGSLMRGASGRGYELGALQESLGGLWDWTGK